MLRPKNRHDLERVGIDDHQLMPHDNIFKAAILGHDVYNRFWNIVKRHGIGHSDSDRQREIDVVDMADIPTGDSFVEPSPLILRQCRRHRPLFRDSASGLFRAGSLLGWTLRHARLARTRPLVLDSAGPPLVRALHRAGMARTRPLLLDSAGPPLVRALHRAGMARTRPLLLDSAGPLLGRALHRAGGAGATLFFLDGAG